jgi:hypothetical protein
VGYVVAAAIAVVVVVIVVWALRRRSRVSSAAPAPEPPKRIVDAAPMEGLETALDQVTDRTGRNMRERIETTTAIDDLRVPEDTGPILRRALDHVEQPHPASANGVADGVADQSVQPPE